MSPNSVSWGVTLTNPFFLQGVVCLPHLVSVHPPVKILSFVLLRRYLLQQPLLHTHLSRLRPPHRTCFRHIQFLLLMVSTSQVRMFDPISCDTSSTSHVMRCTLSLFVLDSGSVILIAFLHTSHILYNTSRNSYTEDLFSCVASNLGAHDLIGLARRSSVIRTSTGMSAFCRYSSFLWEVVSKYVRLDKVPRTHQN